MDESMRVSTVEYVVSLSLSAYVYMYVCMYCI
jgi:hypothetical protein